MRYLFALALLWPLSAQAGWFSYDNYEDCMLGRMKGQNASMQPNADKLCKKEFKVEFLIYTGNIKWSFSHNSGDTVVEIEPNDDYLVSSGKFAFSDKPCSDVKEADMGQPVEIKFNKDLGNYFSMVRMQCARALDFRGEYNNYGTSRPLMGPMLWSLFRKYPRLPNALSACWSIETMIAWTWRIRSRSAALAILPRANLAMPR